MVRIVIYGSGEIKRQMDGDFRDQAAINANEKAQQRLHRLDDINIAEFTPEMLDHLLAGMKLTHDIFELRRRFDENVPYDFP